MRIFETHAHYDDKAFDEDRNVILEEMHAGGVEYIVNVGCSMPNSRSIVEFVKQYDFLYGTVGLKMILLVMKSYLILKIIFLC